MYWALVCRALCWAHCVYSMGGKSTRPWDNQWVTLTDERKGVENRNLGTKPSVDQLSCAAALVTLQCCAPPVLLLPRFSFPASVGGGPWESPLAFLPAARQPSSHKLLSKTSVRADLKSWRRSTSAGRSPISTTAQERQGQRDHTTKALLLGFPPEPRLSVLPEAHSTQTPNL
jgi:hypothetical protein